MNKVIRRLIVLTLLLLLAFGGIFLLITRFGINTPFEFIDRLINYTPQETTVEGASALVYEYTDVEQTIGFDRKFKPDVKEALFEYFRRYNAALGALAETKAFAALYAFDSPDKARDVLVLDELIKRRGENSLTFAECDVGLRLISGSYADEEMVEIRVEERFSTVFNGFGELTSAYLGIEHFFVLLKNRDGWQVKRHDSNSAFFKYIDSEAGKLMAASGLEPEYADVAEISSYISVLRAELQRETLYIPADGEKRSGDYPYERGWALEYVKKWTGINYSPRNHAYPAYEVNSMNFVSQCLDEAGLPFNDTWRRGSAAWKNGSTFYDYVLSGSDSLVAGVCDYTEAETADVIQYLDGGGEVMLTAIISGVADNGELLISSNSDDFTSFPARATGFDIIRVIKIYGYN